MRGGLNTYGYVGGNPLRYGDSKGLDIDWESDEWPEERTPEQLAGDQELQDLIFGSGVICYEGGDCVPVAYGGEPFGGSGLLKACKNLKNITPSVGALKALGQKGFQAHHILPEYLGSMIGYTPKQMMGHPGTLVTQWAHTGKANPKAIHKAIAKYLPPMVGGKKAFYSPEQIMKGLEKAYSDLGRPDLFDAVKDLIKNKCGCGG